MENISDILQNKSFKVGKPRKDDRKRELRQRLSDLTGRTTKSIWASTMIFTEDMLQQAVRHIENYSNIKYRQKLLTEFIQSTKV